MKSIANVAFSWLLSVIDITGGPETVSKQRMSWKLFLFRIFCPIYDFFHSKVVIVSIDIRSFFYLDEEFSLIQELFLLLLHTLSGQFSDQHICI